MNMRIFQITLMVVLMLGSSAAGYDFIYDKSHALGQTILLSQPTATGQLKLPSMVYNENNFILQTGYNRQFEMKELDHLYLAFSGRQKKFGFAFGYSQLGESELYVERTVRLMSSIVLDNFSGGIYYSFRQLDFGEGFEKLSGHGLGLGMSYRLGKFITGLSMDDLNQPKFTEDGLKLQPYFNWYNEFVGSETFSVTARVKWQNKEKTQLGLGQKVVVSNYGSLFWGISTEPMIYGGGVEFNYSRHQMIYSTSYHPVLGFSHSVSLLFGFGSKGEDDVQKR